VLLNKYCSFNICCLNLLLGPSCCQKYSYWQFAENWLWFRWWWYHKLGW